MLGDSRSWIIGLPTDGIKQAKTPDRVLEAFSWAFETRKENYNWSVSTVQCTISTFVDVDFDDFIHPTLNYKYTCPPFSNTREVEDRDKWVEFVADKLNAALVDQLQCFEPTSAMVTKRLISRTPYDMQYTWRTMERRKAMMMTDTVKEGFRYFDDKLVDWFKEWTATVRPQVSGGLVQPDDSLGHLAGSVASLDQLPDDAFSSGSSSAALPAP